ncbi:hypothetical protein Salat_2084400 [Sesamum alatum]|uniref:Uncharacterized protein n=1 Tax=Sesamum alatum TaxID=300844 RepID=A0AAE2CGK5_9LAMI|nr:hypothetical protein Salat_2084400 [Sesamum alatum]
MKAKEAVDKAEEVENLKLIRELSEWWKGGREELRTPKCVSAEMKGEKLVHDWAISERSSVLGKTLGNCIKPAYFLAIKPSWLAMDFGHHLSWKCTYWRKEKFASDTKLTDALKKLEESNSSRVAAEKRPALWPWKLGGGKVSPQVTRPGKRRGLQLSRGISLIRCSQGFYSEDSPQGAHDFLKSPAFKVATEIKATEFLDQGFERCKSQVLKLKGFATFLRRRPPI